MDIKDDFLTSVGFFLYGNDVLHWNDAGVLALVRPWQSDQPGDVRMKVLIAIDNSECSLAAFKSVMESYWPLETEFEIVSVVEPIMGEFPVAITYVDAMVQAQEELKGAAKKFLSQRKEELAEKFQTSCVTTRVYEGDIADTILQRADSFDADLIVLGSHGRRGLNKFLLGSIAERVATHAKCSVEIVRDKNAAKLKKDEGKHVTAAR